MTDFPSFVQINEEGPREGFQFEKGPISTDRKIELIDALSETGLNHIQVASFVNPNRVPGWADADEVVQRYQRKPGIHLYGAAPVKRYFVRHKTLFSCSHLTPLQSRLLCSINKPLLCPDLRSPLAPRAAAKRH